MAEHSLIVDLDDSLIKWDVSFLTLFLALRRYPLWFFKAPYWFLVKGRAYLKERCALAALDQIDPSVFPVREAVVLELEKQREKKQLVILLSASQDIIIKKVASFFPMIDKAYGSSLKDQYKGSKKLKFIEQITEKKQFSYIGDAWVDLKIWSSDLCKTCFLVSRKKSLLKAVINLKKPYVQFKDLPITREGFWLLFKKSDFFKNFFFFLFFFLVKGEIKSSVFLLVLDFYFNFCLLSFSAHLFGDLFFIQEKIRVQKNQDLDPVVSGSISMLTTLEIALLSLLVGLFGAFFLHPFFFLLFLFKFFCDFRSQNPELKLYLSSALKILSFSLIFVVSFLLSGFI